MIFDNIEKVAQELVSSNADFLSFAPSWSLILFLLDSSPRQEFAGIIKAKSVLI